MPETAVEEIWWDGSSSSGIYFSFVSIVRELTVGMSFSNSSSSKYVPALHLAPHLSSLRNPKTNRTLSLRKPKPSLLVLGSIEEEAPSESSEYYLDLGAESPCSTPPNLFETSEFVEQWAAAGVAVPRLVRRPSRRPFNSTGKDKERSKATSTKDAVDRDCGICFEYAVVPCRTLCCGKIFCTEHLEDWLHGPNAEGRCPNCENACSLEGGTLSLATPTLTKTSPQNKRTTFQPTTYPLSPLSSLQPHKNDTLPGSSPASEGWNSTTPTPSSKKLVTLTVSSDSPESTSTAGSVATSTSSENETSSARAQATKRPDIITPTLSTTPFATSWGAMSRFMSIVTFLMFIYKLLS